MSDDADNWPEFERLAEDHRRRDEREPEPRRSDGPMHAGDVPPTDYSDKRRYITGIENVDRSLTALRPGGFTVVGARTGIGKTSFGEQVALVNSRPEHHRVMLATFEMTKEDIRDSLLARLMGYTMLRAEGEIANASDDWRDADAELQRHNLLLWRPDAGGRKNAQTILRTAKKNEIDLLIIDWARYIDDWEAGHAANKICATFSQSVKETGLHIMLLAQLKPEAHGTRPNLTMFEDSGRISQEADKVLLLYRPFLENDKKDVVAEIIIAKNRRGKLKRCHVHWHGAMRSFYAMSEAHEVAAMADCCNTDKKTKSASTSSPAAYSEPAADDEDLGEPPF